MCFARLRILVIFAVSLISLGAVLAPVSAAPGRNNENATNCKNGGYENWTREDGSGFHNTGDCVSYAAQGGTLVERETRTLAVTFSYGYFASAEHQGLCHTDFAVTGFVQGDYSVYVEPHETFTGPYDLPVGPDGTGSGTTYSGTSRDYTFLNGTEVTVTVDGLSITSTVSCTRPGE